MSALNESITNRNFLSPLNFEFRIKKSPHVNFFLQKVNIPNIELREVTTSNPFVTVPYPGEHITFSPLMLEFKVDEDLKNYLEIRNWITALGKPQEFEQYRAIAEKPSYTGDGIYSDVTLIPMTSTKMPNYEVVYVDAFPVSLSQISFFTTDENVSYLTASTTFKYSYFTIDKIA
jgi:hypothetical protein